MTSLSPRRRRDKHLRRIEGRSDDSLLDHSPLEPSLEDALPDGSSPWPITRALGRVLANAVIRENRRRILEFGAGSSSVVFAKALSSIGGGTLTSIESAPEWCAEPWSRVLATPGIDARLVAAKPELRLTREGLVYLFEKASQAIADRGPFDLVLVDAPQFYYGRDGALILAWAAMASGALVVLDDAAREGERYTAARWLRTFPGLDLIAFRPEFAGRGIAILRRARDSAPRFDWWSFVTGTFHTLRARRARKGDESTPVPILGADTRNL